MRLKKSECPELQVNNLACSLKDVQRNESSTLTPHVKPGIDKTLNGGMNKSQQDSETLGRAVRIQVETDFHTGTTISRKMSLASPPSLVRGLAPQPP